MEVKMKKIVVLASLVLIAALVGVGALGVFTSSDTSTGNLFSTGTLIVHLNGQNTAGNPATHAHFNVSNLAPGDTVTAYVEVRNDGTLPMLFRMYLPSGSVSDSSGLASQLKVRVTLRPAEYAAPTGYTAYGSTDDVLVDWGAGQSVANLIGVENALDNVEAAQENPPWPLYEDYIAIYKIEVNLPLDTGNAYQGKSFSGTLQIDATQYDNQDLNAVIWE
jgi:predicted ribosomally synthesized peptide with SipW-like signal peptide